MFGDTIYFDGNLDIWLSLYSYAIPYIQFSTIQYHVNKIFLQDLPILRYISIVEESKNSLLQ